MKNHRRHFLKCAGLLPATAAIRQLFATQDCRVTTPDILGPFYQPEAPFRTRIASRDEPGERLLIEGTVSDCKGPIAGAVVEIWQANADGCYSINEDCGVVPGNPDHFRLRGRVGTGESGDYAFETIKPAPYATGPGRFRPSHIHYRIAAPGRNGEGDVELITQLYFQGERYNDTDPHSSRPEAQSRIVPLVERAGEDTLLGRFDIVLPELEGGGSASPDAAEGHDLLIYRRNGKMVFHLPEKYPNRQSLTLYAPNGRLIRSWASWEKAIEWEAREVDPGACIVYLCDKDDTEIFHLRI